jgi:hypothetical protein
VGGRAGGGGGSGLGGARQFNSAAGAGLGRAAPRAANGMGWQQGGDVVCVSEILFYSAFAVWIERLPCGLSVAVCGTS